MGPPTDQEWEALLALAVLSCAGVTTVLKHTIDQYFVDSYVSLLASHFPSAVDVSWDEAEETLRRHIVTGGLDIRVRRQLFEEHMRVLGSGGGEAE